MKLKIILPAHLIPEKTIVSKPTGTKEYVLSDTFSIYKKEGEKTEIDISGSFRLLVRLLVEGTSANVISEDENLAVSFTGIKDMIDFLKDIEDNK